MGMAADGILFWGIWYSQDEIPERDDEQSIADLANDIESALLDANCPSPEESYDRSRATTDSQYAEQWAAWRTRYAEYTNKMVTFRYAGFCDHDGNIFVTINESKKTAEWDEMVPITSLATDHEWEPRLREFVTKLGLSWKEPGWFLTSHYG